MVLELSIGVTSISKGIMPFFNAVGSIKGTSYTHLTVWSGVFILSSLFFDICGVALTRAGKITVKGASGSNKRSEKQGVNTPKNVIMTTFLVIGNNDIKLA